MNDIEALLQHPDVDVFTLPHARQILVTLLTFNSLRRSAWCNKVRARWSGESGYRTVRWPQKQSSCVWSRTTSRRLFDRPQENPPTRGGICGLRAELAGSQEEFPSEFCNSCPCAKAEARCQGLLWKDRVCCLSKRSGNRLGPDIHQRPRRDLVVVFPAAGAHATRLAVSLMSLLCWLPFPFCLLLWWNTPCCSPVIVQFAHAAPCASVARVSQCLSRQMQNGMEGVGKIVLISALRCPHPFLLFSGPLTTLGRLSAHP